MYCFQKRRKELEESSVNDSILLSKSSLDIDLLPETEEDRNLANLLSLKPSKSIEEKQIHVRKSILNSPALPSSSGLITSFGGLKKEEQLKKSKMLSRNLLGISVKKKINKTEKGNNADKDEVEKSSVSTLEVCAERNVKNIECDEHKINDDSIEQLREMNIQNREKEKIQDKEINNRDCEHHTNLEGTSEKLNDECLKGKDGNLNKISLVVDYSSSGDGSDVDG